MSSTQTVPPPVQYRPYRRRSIAGPIVLIVLGVFFLLANMHIITWHRMALWFAQFWPVLIILWGIIKLVEYYSAQRGGYRTSGVGAGGVILLIFLVMFGLAATRASRVNWNAVGNDMDIDTGMFGWFGQTYSFTDQAEQPFTAGSSIQVVSDRGNINLNAWDENKVRVVVHKRVNADGQDSANRANDETKPVVTTNGTVITINANTSGGGNTRVESDLDIYVPRAAAADISTRRGDVLVRARDGGVKVQTSRGDVTVEDVKGDASITTRRGSIQANNITGDLAVDGRVDEITVNNIGGEVRLNGEFTGSTKLAKIGKGVQFTSSRTDLHFGKLDGEMTMDLGELRANQLAGPFSVVTRSKDIRLEDVTGDVKVENTNGEVEVHAGKQLGNIDIDNHRGEISVTVPANAAFQLDARTQRGEIQAQDFPGLNVNSGHGEATAAGTIGNGGSRLSISNQYGGIQIRKAG